MIHGYVVCVACAVLVLAAGCKRACESSVECGSGEECSIKEVEKADNPFERDKITGFCECTSASCDTSSSSSSSSGVGGFGPSSSSSSGTGGEGGAGGSSGSGGSGGAGGTGGASSSGGGGMGGGT